MHARRRFPGGHHFRHLAGVPLRVQFLVLLCERARMRAWIPGASCRFVARDISHGLDDHFTWYDWSRQPAVGGVCPMKRFLTCVTLAACVFSTTAAVAPQQQPVFRGGSDIVRVFVTVIDHEGRLVTTLTQDKFEVRDEGK